MKFADILVILIITAGATKAAAFFLAEMGSLTKAERRSVAIQSVGIQAAVLAVFAAFGPNIMDFFHVSIAALEIAGGLILLLFAIGLVLGEDHSHEESSSGGKSIAIYPLATPLLASPQAIVAVTIASTSLGMGDRGPLWSALAVVVAANFAIMFGLAQFSSDKPAARKGPGFSAILLRIVALLLAALAIEIIALGLRGYGIIGPMPEAVAQAPAAH